MLAMAARLSLREGGRGWGGGTCSERGGHELRRGEAACRLQRCQSRFAGGPACTRGWSAGVHELKLGRDYDGSLVPGGSFCLWRQCRSNGRVPSEATRLWNVASTGNCELTQGFKVGVGRWFATFRNSEFTLTSGSIYGAA